MLALLNPRWAVASTALLTFNLVNPSLAFAEPESSQELVQEEAVQPELPKQFISEGNTVAISDVAINITPPAGWEVFTDNPNLSLIMKEVALEEKTKDYSKPKFRRNITVAATHEGTPIDEKRATILKEQMSETFAKDPAVSNFEVLEHKFFDYKGKNDGLILYSALNLGEFPMMQMHILVSGLNRQFLLTYTDLASNFQNTQAFEQAWNSMVSIEVTGPAPKRYQELIRYGSLAGGAILLLLIALGIKRRSTKKLFDMEDDLDEDLDSSLDLNTTMNHGWNLSKKDNNDDFLEGVSSF